tara:strand:+ start:47 stop:211 length:165 start_codon:yes stop_codon:yes gene_type:complete
MATVKGLYDLIKKEETEGKELSPFEQAIVEAYEEDVTPTTKEIHISYVENKENK